jgi:hypothetical protein
MLHHLGLLLNMLILLRYFSLVLLPLLVLLSLDHTWLLSGYGWFLESLRRLRHIAVIISHGVPQTSYPFMEGEFHVPSPYLLVSVIVLICLLLKFISPFFRADFHDYHHRLLYTKSGNYSSTFTYMDR